MSSYTGFFYIFLSTFLFYVFDISFLYSSIADKSRNRGYAFVEYESHRSAAVARRKCAPNRLQLWGKTVAVDWAEPEPMVDEEILSKVYDDIFKFFVST